MTQINLARKRVVPMKSNQIKILFNNKKHKDFPFKKIIEHMLSISKREDILGLDMITISDSVPDTIKSKEILQSCYYTDCDQGCIALFLENILNRSIPDYAFDFYHEIAGLLLSKFIFHEIGHHVHYAKRHGIKKHDFEFFADKYAKAGYCKYFLSRSSKILSSYRWASINFIMFSRKERKIISNSRQELISNLLQGEKEIIFP